MAIDHALDHAAPGIDDLPPYIQAQYIPLNSLLLKSFYHLTMYSHIQLV